MKSALTLSFPFLTLCCGLAISFGASAAETQTVKTQTAGTMTNLITPPVQYPPETIKFKGRPAAIASISAFGTGGYSVKVTPIAGATKGIKSGEITCNKGILVLQFNPQEDYTGVLQSCPANAKVSIVLK
ncbi:MAG: hypothetical protein QM523_07595 [Candidatus Pacebacteria bacterium]|nr:hypothetical protein [Candidatus Paceibacterota bacterium]